MIKITSVEIDGFIVPSQKVKLDFVDSNVVCIYGNNGSGKTTFLEILFAVFDRDEEILKKHNVNKVTITTLEEKSPYIIEKIENTEKWQKILLEEIDNINSDIDTYIREMKSQYYWSQIEEFGFKDISSLFLGIGRGIHKKELNIPRNTVWHFFNTNKKINEDKVLTGNEIDSLSDKLFDYLMPKGKNDINRVAENEIKEIDDKKNIYLPSIEIDTLEILLNTKYKEAVIVAQNKVNKSLSETSLNLLYSASNFERNIDLKILRDKLIYNRALLLEIFSKDEGMGIKTILNSLESDESVLESIDSLKQIILFDMVQELEREVELFQEIQLFVDEYNKFLNDDKRLVIDKDGVFISPKNHSLQRLSSGERHLLTFLATILLMGEEQDFILLDEPEISLDIEWQEKLLSTISKLAPNSQIIVASHSPSIMGDYFDESVEIILSEKL